MSLTKVRTVLGWAVRREEDKRKFPRISACFGSRLSEKLQDYVSTRMVLVLHFWCGAAKDTRDRPKEISLADAKKFLKIVRFRWGCSNTELYKTRHIIENMFPKLLKDWKGAAFRSNTYAHSFRSFVAIALIFNFFSTSRA